LRFYKKIIKMSKEKTNVNKNEVKNIEFTIKVTKAINVLNEPLQKFILDKQTMAKEVKKIKRFDFGNSLKYIRDNLDQIFQNHPDFDESRRKELDKIVKRCIAIRNKAAHQGTMRDVEPLCRLAALLGSEVDSIVKNVLKGDTDEDMARIRSSDGEKESWKSLKELGNVHVKEGRFNEAIIAYTRAIRLDPNQCCIRIDL
jgi:tetratricopeptide (TPR) repeat protein